MGRTICVGDLHGCYDEATALLAKMQVQADDWIVFLGDYCDRGPENAKCCDLVRHREQVQGKPAGILGNHEERHLEHEDDFQRHGSTGQIPPTHAATRAQLRPEHYAWFRTLPLFVRFPEHNAVAVHAGVFPGRPIEEQDPHHLLHIQMVRPYDFDSQGNRTVNTYSKWPSKVANDPTWRFWTHYWDGPEFVVFGHSVLDRPLITDRIAGIDGGCCFGRELHGLVLDTKEVYTVSSTRDYGKGRRGTQTADIGRFLVHGDVSTFS